MLASLASPAARADRAPSSSIEEEEDENGDESFESMHRSSNFFVRIFGNPRFQFRWRSRVGECVCSDWLWREKKEGV